MSSDNANLKAELLSLLLGGKKIEAIKLNMETMPPDELPR
jgi:hypothetical protein